MPEVEATNSTKFSVKVNVPEDTPEGTYPVIIYFTSSELPFLVYATINVTVDNAPPTISIVSPKSEAVVSGNITIEAYTIDPSEIETVKFDTETMSALMSFDDITGYWTGNLDTTKLSDGINIIKVTTIDKARNSFEKTITMIVDNTAPSANITSPEDETQLNGTVTVRFDASDPNIELVQLIIGNTVFNVTGVTSYEWDTTTVGDDAYKITLVAYDKAGNTATAHVTVTTTNVQKATEEAYATGEEEGYASGKLEGYEEGYATGEEEGYTTGREDGYKEGNITGRNSGVTIGALIGFVIGAIGSAVVVLTIAKIKRKQS